MKKITFLIFLFLFSLGEMNAQIWTINSCTSATSGSTTYGPMYSTSTANANNRTAVIYPSTQLTGLAGETLTSMYFNRTTATGSMAGTPNFKIYLKEVTATDFGSTALDWATDIATATLVYDSNPAAVVGSSSGWKEFDFTTNFVYTGTQNLAIYFEYSNSTASSFISWNYEFTAPCIDTANNNTTKYNNNTTGTLATSLASTNYRRPIIGFDFVVSCNAPSMLTSSNLTTTGVDIAWTENAIQPQNGYEYYNSTVNTAPSATETPTGTTAMGVATTTLTGLTPATTYYFWVRGNCGAADKSVWTGPIAYTTLCTDVTEFVENFDSWPTGSAAGLPVCWSRLGSSTSAYLSTGANAPMSPSNRMYTNISATTDLFVLLPPVSNLQANTHRLKFKAYCTTASKVLSVGYLSTPGDITTYVEIDPLQMPSTNLASTQEFTVVPTGIPAGVTQLVLAPVTGASTTIYIDDVKWEVNSSCVEPTALTASAITSTDATLGWTNGGVETLWDIQYGLTNFALGTGTMINGVTANPHALTGLMANTEYQFYVRAVCTGPENSSWAGPFTFKTQCNEVTEFSEDFEGYATGSTNPMPDCWARGGTGSTYLLTGAVAPMSPVNRLYMFASGTTPTEAYAILPPVSNLQANTHRLKFKGYVTVAGRFIEVGYYTDPSDVTTFVQIQEVYLPSTTVASTQEFIINITGIPAGVKNLGIKNPGFPSATTAAYIDDVVWEAIPACPSPTALNATNVLTTTADLSWTEMGSATLWNVEYGTPGFTQGMGTTVTGVTSNPYTLTGLMPSTTYDYYVQADCGGTSGSSVWEGPFSFTTACTAFVAPYEENFDSLALVTPYTELPTCWEPQATGSDFWDVTNDVINTGHTYLPNIGDHTTGTANYMWIDASTNILANEMVTPLIDMSALTSPFAGFWFASDNTNNTINHTIALDVWDGTAWLNIATETGNFTGWTQVAAVVPSTVPSTTKFRIYAIANPAGTSTDYYFNDLGVDDFFVKETPSCPIPNSLMASNETSSSVDLAWTELGTATLWNIEYGTTGFVQGAGTAVNGITTNPYSLSGLMPATTYEVYLQSDCGGTSGVSSWIGPISFTTTCVAFTAPYTENFDGLALVSPFTDLPNCWETQVGPDFWDVTDDVINTGHTYLPNVGDHTTGTANYMWIDASGNITANEMVSPLIDMSALTTPVVGFWFASDNVTNTINHTIALDVWDGTAWLNITTESGNFTGWTKVSGSVPSTVPTTTKFRIYAIANPAGTSSDYFYNDLGVDDFFVEEAPTSAPICATNIVATPSATCGNEATLISWDPTATASGYYMSIGTTTGGTDILNNVDIGSTPAYSLVGLINTTYYFTITPFNTIGSATGCTEQSFITAATGCYCASVPTSNDANGITNVMLGTTNFPNGDVTYFDHSATAVSVAQGDNTNLMITFDTSIYDYNTHVWIDFNDDFIFDASEIVFSGVSGTTSPNTLNASFLMPATAPLGTHKMRIGSADTGQTTANPCYSSSYGVTLDFSVTITPLLAVDNFDNVSFVAYPNPVKDVLNISYSSEITSYRIINLLGQEVKSNKVGNTSTQIDMSNLSAGTYLLNVTIEDYTKTIKVVKE